MCFGGGVRTPNIVYQGPTDADLASNQKALDEYAARIGQQQSDFDTQLQAQIDAANTETAALKDKLAQDSAALEDRLSKESAAANAAIGAQQTGAYAASAQVSEGNPEGAQTTAAVTKKKKPKSNLKINRAGLVASAGAGTNYGV